MKQLSQLGVSLSVCFLASAIAWADADMDANECVFEAAEIAETRFSANPAVADYSWNSQDKIAKGVLTSGALFHVQYWACQHYGARAISVVGPLMEVDPQALRREFISLANASLDRPEAALVEKYLAENPPGFDASSATLIIENQQYAEFTLRYDLVSDLAVLEVKHYRD